MAYAIRAQANRVLPAGLRLPLRMLGTYAKRLLVWPVILLQVRGEGAGEQFKLIVSALAAPVVSLRNLDDWQDLGLLFDTAVVARGVGRFRWRRWCDDLWHVLPWREPAVLKFIRDTLKPSDVFIDAGGNVGVYSVVAAKLVGNRGHLMAVEMMPDTAARLRGHLAVNAAEQVHVVEWALTDDTDQVLIARVPEGHFGQASISSARVNDAGLRPMSVTTTTLARLLDGIPHVALLKMEIEGAELQALRGAGSLIRVEGVIFESWSESCGVAEYPLSMGYDVRRLDGRSWVAGHMRPLKNLDTRTKMVSFILPDLSSGGAERVQLSLANEFMARGHPIEFVLLRAEGDLIPWLSAETGLVDMKSKRLRNALLPLARYLRKRRPDACLAAMWPLTSLAVWARDLARVPTRLVLSDHTDFMAAPEAASACSRFKLRHTMRWTYPRADGVVTVSRGAAGSLATLTGMAPEGITLIHNPIRPPSSGEIGQSCVAAAAWSAHQGPRLIAVGSLKPAKNFALLLTAFAKVRQHSNARLLILGEGPLRGVLEALISRLGLGGAVDMPGFVASPYPYLAKADVFVLSSAWEGFGNVIVEALACGTKVVSTDCRSGPREILADGRYGMLVAPGDAAALAQAIRASLAAHHDRAALIRRSQDFSVAKAAEQYLELLFPRVSSKGPSCLKSKW